MPKTKPKPPTNRPRRTRSARTRGVPRTSSTSAPPEPPASEPPRTIPSHHPSSALDDATLTAHEVAELLGVNPKTVYEAAARDQIPNRRLGRRVLFPRAAIEAWLSAPTVERGMMTEPTRVAGKQVTR